MPSDSTVFPNLYLWIIKSPGRVLVEVSNCMGLGGASFSCPPYEQLVGRRSMLSDTPKEQVTEIPN